MRKLLTAPSIVLQPPRQPGPTRPVRPLRLSLWRDSSSGRERGGKRAVVIPTEQDSQNGGGMEKGRGRAAAEGEATVSIDARPEDVSTRQHHAAVPSVVVIMEYVCAYVAMKTAS